MQVQVLLLRALGGAKTAKPSRLFQAPTPTPFEHSSLLSTTKHITSSLTIGRQDKMTRPSGDRDGRPDVYLSTPCPMSDLHLAAKQACATLATLLLPLPHLEVYVHQPLPIRSRPAYFPRPRGIWQPILLC